MNVNCPVCAVLPLSWPLLPKENPDGSDPDATDQEYGKVPPFAPKRYTYDVPDCTPGTDEVVIASELVGGALAGFTVIFALALLVASAKLVAVIVTEVFELTDGAVNSPAFEMVPTDADQVTPVLLVPKTVAANCWPLPAVTVADEGDTEILTVVTTGATFTIALALLLLSAVLVARTVTVVAVVTLGATKFPEVVMLPALADQVTAVLLVP